MQCFLAKIWKYALFGRPERFFCALWKAANSCHPVYGETFQKKVKPTSPNTLCIHQSWEEKPRRGKARGARGCLRRGKRRQQAGGGASWRGGWWRGRWRRRGRQRGRLEKGKPSCETAGGGPEHLGGGNSCNCNGQPRPMSNKPKARVRSMVGAFQYPGKISSLPRERSANPALEQTWTHL